jgi:hypothetical protein
MNYTDEDIRELIKSGSETPNLDYKITAIWDTNHTQDRLDIIKDILAMSNTRDGGKIVIGVDDKTKEYRGLSDEAYASFDVTKVNQLLNNYADPAISCEVICRSNLDGKKVVVIIVPEFPVDPIICKKNVNDPHNKPFLIKGGLYTRTVDCSSELVSSADETRRILEIGLNKKSDEILAKISRLLAASENRRNKATSSEKTVVPITTQTDLQVSDYKNEITEANTFFNEKISKLQGYWEVIAHPQIYDSKRLSDPMKAYEAVRKSVIHLRGWDYPHDDNHGDSTNFVKGRQSFTVWEKHHEAWRMYKSGLFIWKGNYWEDARGYSEDGKRVLSFVSVIYQVTEILLFLKRLYTQNLKISNTIEIKITLSDCGGRKLAALEPGVIIGEYYISGETTIPIDKEIQSIEIEATPEIIARDIIKEIFMLFNWNDPADSMIEGWQKKLMERGGL